MVKKKKQKLTEKEVWTGTILRAVALFGLVFFSNCLTLGLSSDIFVSALLLSCLYYFSEIARFYGFNPKDIIGGINRNVLDTKQKRVYTFLLW